MRSPCAPPRETGKRFLNWGLLDCDLQADPLRPPTASD